MNIDQKGSVAIVPLAMPLLAGPVAISSVIVADYKSNKIIHLTLVGVAIAALSGPIWCVLRLSPIIISRLRTTGINVFSRIMRLILAAIAIEIITNGLKYIFPAPG